MQCRLPFVVPTCLPGVVRQTVAAQLDAHQDELARIRAELAEAQASPLSAEVKVTRDSSTGSAGFDVFVRDLTVTKVWTTSTAYQSGLREGCLVQAVDGQRVASHEDYMRLAMGKRVFNMTVAYVRIIVLSHYLMIVLSHYRISEILHCLMISVSHSRVVALSH